MKSQEDRVKKYIRGWTGGGKETPCGCGSKIGETEIQREWIPQKVIEHKIHSIADIGAGDLNWMKLVKWPADLEYKAFDLYPRHESIQQFDIVEQIPERVDLILCMWVLNHMDEDEARIALGHITQACDFLIYTYYPPMWDFTDLDCIDSVVIRPHKKAELRLVRC